MKRAGAKSTLILSREENKLSIEIQDRIKRNFSLNLIEIDKEDKDIPNLEFSSKVEINSIDLVAAIEDSAVVADACSFIIEDGKFIIESKSMNSSRAEFSGDEAEIKAENCKARYSLEYLQKFMKGAKICDKTVLNFADDHPLRVDFRMENLEINFVQAILGDEIEFKHFDKTLSLKVPEGTQPSTILRLKGKGLPYFNYDGHGDLYVKVDVKIPSKTSKEQKKILLDYTKTLKDKKIFDRVKGLFS